MSRKSILTFAAAATLAVATLAAQSADARGFGGFGGGGFGGGGIGAGRTFGGGAGIGMARFHGPSGGARLTILNPGGPRGGNPGLPGRPPGRLPPPPHLVLPLPPPPLPHGHWVFRGGRWIIPDDVVISEPVAAPGPCTCLTKTYTPSGLVVFADVCTKESASAPVDSHVDATQVPTSPVAATAVPISVVPTAPNYAGRTYEDYLAANPQVANPQAANPQAPQAPQN